MGQKRRQHRPEFKFKIALEATKETKTVSQIASKYELHPNQISHWKKQLLAEGKTIYRRANHKQQRQQTAWEAELYEQIGRLKMELEWLKKKSGLFDDQ